MMSETGKTWTKINSEFLPYRCSLCGSDKRFQSLIALRMHSSVVHSIPLSPVQEQHKSSAENSENNHKIVDADDKDDLSFNKKLQETLNKSDRLEQIFKKYSGKMDAILNKYDKEADKLQERVNYKKQLDKIKVQQQELFQLQTSWKAVHGMSQLVKDTEEIINKRIKENGFSIANEETVINNPSIPPMVPTLSFNNEDSLYEQVENSVHLAAKYKALAIEAEEKLKDKEIEEENMRKHMEVVVEKESIAKKKLAGFMEQLLNRTELAESQLKLYQSQEISPNNHTRSKSFNEPSKEHKAKRQRSKTLDSNTFPSKQDSRLGHSSKGKFTKNKLYNDPYVQNILEAPSSLELPRKFPPRQKQLEGLDTSNLMEGHLMMPFSNQFGRNKCDVTTDRHISLFCVFARLSSIDLLRCSLVCREWRDISQHPQLWSRVSFSNLRVAPKFFMSISRQCSATCYLSLKNISLQGDIKPAPGLLEKGLEEILKSCGDNLLVLAIDSCDHVITNRSIWLVSCYNRKIRMIVYRSAKDPLCNEVVWALGSNCRDIVTLEVAPLYPCSVGLFDNNIARLLSWCWPNLQALSFGGKTVDGAGMLAVALNCHHIKVLELVHAKGVTEEAAISICKHGFNELHSLIFTHTPIQARTVRKFLHKLKSLNLLHIVVKQSDFFPGSKKNAKNSEYEKITKDLKSLQQNGKYKGVLDVKCL